MKTELLAVPTLELREAGQSPWLDQINRQLIASGRLQSLIGQNGLLGVTSNPTIFEKAITQKNSGYEKDIRKLIAAGKSTFEIYDDLTVSDIRTACDLFREVHAESGGEHGFVSLEVMPALADDSAGTVREALRLVKTVARENLMIKVPATPAGIAAIRTLIGQGVHVNATLIFSLKQYSEVAEAYLGGLEDLARRRGDLRRVRSVASAFVSRFDSLIDKQLESMSHPDQDPFSRENVDGLRGKSAIANSKLLYREFRRLVDSDRFRKLAAKGAHCQKLLWGSTSTKNPAYPDLLYVEPLVGRDTVNTMPLETLEAFLDHGHVCPDSAAENYDEALETKARLKALGIDLDSIGEILQGQGVRAFCESFDSLMKSIEALRAERKSGSGMQAWATVRVDLGSEKIGQKLEAALQKLEKAGFQKRLFEKDPGLWKKDASHQAVIANRLGWLTVPDWMSGQLYLLDCLKCDARENGITDVVLFGMGGSSLAPEVMSLICKREPGSPRFHVLDTTDPGSVLNVEKNISLKSTLFIVASKSGSTIETQSQYRYFAAKAKDPSRFVAITDKGSALEKSARENKFRNVFVNPGDIGGRYSALSFFGLVPAALMGVDFRGLAGRAQNFLAATRSESSVRKNPGIYLGAVLGVLAGAGKDKLTIITSKSLASFGAWLEQLIAESTGKEGEGIIPIDGEALAEPAMYRPDRVFAVLKLKGESSAKDEEKIKQLRKQGFPVIEFEWPDRLALGAEFLRWEIATAVSSAWLGINPFDEPNVKEAKDATGEVLEGLKKAGKLAGIDRFKSPSSKLSVAPFLGKMTPKGYLALLVYGPRTKEWTDRFNRLRLLLRDGLRRPVLVGFGPRYLHSIGQLYKGGPQTGLFMEFIVQEKKDAQVPQAGYSFGQLIKAQALGDLKALQRKKLPTLAVDLGTGEDAGFNALVAQVSSALSKGSLKKS
jgi:transaldolase/glucose-6-phosphate isomerase